MRAYVSRIATLLSVMGSIALIPGVGRAQDMGEVTGVVTRVDDGSALSGVTVSVVGTGSSTVTGRDGRFTLQRVPSGQQTIWFRQLGQRPVERTVTVVGNATVTLDVALAEQAVRLAEIVVSGASRAPERVVEAPAAVTVVDAAVTRDISVTGQAPLAVANAPGVDVAQSGMADFNVNARGFNTTLNRRVLVLQDGRDLAVAFLGAQEWNAMTLPTEDFGRREMVRGPGSALYGANAFSGVLNIVTPPARDITGTKLTLAGGGLFSDARDAGSSLRADLRHAGTFGQGRFGYRVNVGYQSTDDWTRARTRFDGSDLVNEYAGATDSAVPNQNSVNLDEVRPLSGQTVDPLTGAAVGTPEAATSLLGSARFDYYLDNGSILTVDGGASRTTNGVVVTGLGRVQIKESLRPYARVNWAANNFNLLAWYSGRTTPDSQATLSSAISFRETSAMWHLEGQYNRQLLDDRLRVVLGSSFRMSQVDTKGTLMPVADDDRSDNFYSAYSQVEYRLIPQIRLVGALRFDESDLYDPQWSPKAAAVFSPNDDHSFRLTFNRAFQTPNYSEWFLLAPASAPSTTPRSLEVGFENYFAGIKNHPQLGPAFADLSIPNAVPWNFDSLTIAQALGNDSLRVETVRGWEVGYKGTVANRFFVSVDVFFSELKNFVTDLLPCVNPQYPCYALNQDVDVIHLLDTINVRIDQLVAANQLTPAQAAALKAPQSTLRVGYSAVNGALGPVLATLPSGIRTGIVSYANAGRVLETGVEFGLGASLTDEWRVDGSYGLIDFTVREAPIEELVPNTPQHRGALGLSYRGRQGLEGNVTFRFSSGHQWFAGVFQGWVPSRQTVDMSLGYAINDLLRVFAVGTNVLDQQRFHLYGGSLVGRRVMGGVTATF